MQNYNSTLNTDSTSESAREVDLYDYPKFLAAFQKHIQRMTRYLFAGWRQKHQIFLGKPF